MGKVELFHGSQFVIEKPEYGKGSRTNDYGQGFYCTRHVDLAREWACAQEGDGKVNRYALATEGLNILRFNGPGFTTLNWLALLMNNRVVRLSTPMMRRAHDWLLANCLPNIDDADVIVGYRADDAYFSFVRAFVANGISLGQLSRVMRLGELGEQQVIKSPRAFEALEFLGFDQVDASLWYPRKKARGDAALAAYQAELEQEDEDSVYIRDLVEGKVALNDPRIL